MTVTTTPAPARIGIDPPNPAIAIAGISVSFDGIHALSDVTLGVAEHEVFGLIGPNGAGKTTLMNVLSGFQKPDRGTVHISGESAKGWSPQRIVRSGVSRTFQAVRPFAGLTVSENIELGALGVGQSRRAARERTMAVLQALHLTHRRDTPAGKLPHGEERRLGIGRALASDPKALLLDEPAAGANESESDELVASLLSIRDNFSCALVIIEHDMRLIMGICERIHVLDFGRSIAEGTPEQVRSDPAVLAAYLGMPET